MTLTRWLRRASLPGLVAVATGLTLGGGAMAATLTGSGIVFATQAVTASSGGGTVTIGVGGGVAGAPMVYTSNACGLVGAVSFSITFTLPTGATYTSNPSATGGATFAAAMSQVSGGIGQPFITFTGNAACAAVGDTGTVTLGSFGLAGATALATPNTTTFKMKPTVSSVTAGLNDSGPTGSQVQIASSASAIQFTTVPSTVVPLQVDVTNPSLGASFLQNGVVSKIGDQGAVAVLLPGGLQKADDTGAFGPPTTSNVVLTGNWGGIATPFLLAGAAAQATSCPATAPAGAVVGTVSGNTITFANVVLPAVGAAFNYEVCLVSSAVSGKSVIASNAQTTASVSATGALVITPGGSAIFLDGYTYNGTIQQLLYTGSFAPYQGFVRIVNNTATTVSPAVLVQPDSGTPGLNTSLTVPGNANTLVSATSIITGAGAVPDSTGRVSLLFLTPGAACVNGGGGVAAGGGGPACTVSISSFIVNPNGTVTQLGAGAAP